MFLLLLQLAGINFSGAIVFALFGLGPKGVRFDRGRSWVRWSSIGATVAGIAYLLVWQFSMPTELQRSSREQRIKAEVKETIEASHLAHLVEANVRFTRSGSISQESVLIVAYAARAAGVDMPDTEIKTALVEKVQKRVSERESGVTPLIEITLLRSP